MNCDRCSTPARMLAPVGAAMVCEGCWTNQRLCHIPHQVISATKPDKFFNHDGMAFVMLLDEATGQAARINQASEADNAVFRSKPDLFGPNPPQGPTDYRAVAVSGWTGRQLAWRSRAKVVA